MHDASNGRMKKPNCHRSATRCQSCKGKLYNFWGEFLTLPAPPWPQMIKATQKSSKMVQNYLSLICPNNLSSLLFWPLLHLSKCCKIRSKSGQHFAMTKRHNRLSIKSPLLCMLRKLLKTNTKMMQSKLVSTEHNIGHQKGSCKQVGRFLLLLTALS